VVEHSCWVGCTKKVSRIPSKQAHSSRFSTLEFGISCRRQTTSGSAVSRLLLIAGILLLEPSTQFFIRRAAGMSTYQYIIHSMLAPALLEAPHHHTVLLVPLRHNMRARFLSKYDHDQRDSTTLLATISKIVIREPVLPIY
jgi:hypothetical protein